MPDIAYFVGPVAKALQWQGVLFPVKGDGALRRTTLAESGENILDPDGAQLVCGAEDAPLTARLVPMRGFAFLNTATGMHKLGATDDDVATLAHGLPIPAIREAGFVGSGTKLEDGHNIAYRGIYARKTVSESGDELWTYSVPSSRVIITNTTGSMTINPTLQLDLPSNIVAGDWLILYGSRPTGSDPDDELAELFRREISETEVTAGAIQFTDAVPSERRGAALYTNPSRGGFARANFEAPVCRAMAEYRGSLFFADLLEPRRIELRFAEGGDCTGDATGIGYRTISGRRTNGSATISNVTSVTGVERGMMIYSPGSNWAGSSPVTVGGISGGGPFNLDMGVVWNGASDGANVDIVLVDTIRIGGSYYPICEGSDLSSPQLWPLIRTLDVATPTGPRTSPSTAYRAYATLNSLTWNSSSNRDLLQRATVVIEERRAGLASNSTIYATHGGEYDPPLPVVAGADDKFIENDTRRNGLGWSKTSEPQHVPLGNRQPVGSDGQARIVALVEARDALWIFQENGRVWRLYGFGEASGWRIDPFDYGHVLVGYGAIAKLEETVFAVTTKGAIALTDAGAMNISDGFIGSDLASRMPSVFDPLSEGVSLAANEKHKELVFTFNDGTSGENDYESEIYCFNIRNKRWSTWELPHEPIGFLCNAGRYFYFTPEGGSGRSYLIAERLEDDTYRYADMEYGLTVGPEGANVRTLSAIEDDPFDDEDYDFQVGDLMVRDLGGARAIITEIIDSDSVGIYADSGNTIIGASTIYRAFEIELKWRPFALGDLGAVKYWREMVLSFDPWSKGYTWEVGFDSEADDEEETAYTGTLNGEGSRHERAIVQRAHTRRIKLIPRFTVKQAGLYFRLVGLTLQVDPIGPRVER